MREITFIIRVTSEDGAASVTTKPIPESELKRRLAMIAPRDLLTDDGQNAVTEEDIDLLFYGD